MDLEPWLGFEGNEDANKGQTGKENEWDLSKRATTLATLEESRC